MFLNLISTTQLAKYYIWSVSIILIHLTITKKLCMSRAIDGNPPQKKTVQLHSPLLFRSHEEEIQIELVSPFCPNNASRTIYMTDFDVDKDVGSVYELTLLRGGMISVESGGRKVIYPEVDLCHLEDWETVEMTFRGVTSLWYKEDGSRHDVDSTAIPKSMSAPFDRRRPLLKGLVNSSTPTKTTPTTTTTESTFSVTWDRQRLMIIISVLSLFIIVFVSATTIASFFIYKELESRRRDNDNDNDDDSDNDDDDTRNENRLRPTASLSSSSSNLRQNLRQSEATTSPGTPEVDLDLPPSYADLQENHPPPPAYDEALHQVQKE